MTPVELTDLLKKVERLGADLDRQDEHLREALAEIDIAFERLTELRVCYEYGREGINRARNALGRVTAPDTRASQANRRLPSIHDHRPTVQRTEADANGGNGGDHLT
jgi:hypothetical protein